jgi:uncharacterized membrane-anchored protein
MLPTNHPLRLELNDEVHARPTEGLEAPGQLTYLVLVSEAARRETDWREARALFQSLGGDLPETPVNHRAVSVGASGPSTGGTRLVLERHSEFLRYTVFTPREADHDEVSAAHQKVIAALGDLTGQTLVATRVEILRGAELAPGDLDLYSATTFGTNVVVGSQLGEGAARAITDFRIGEDGQSRLLFFIDDMRPRQAGRMVQRLLEIDTYRMMALLALPIARELRPQIEDMDRELAAIVSAIAQIEAHKEAELLERLTRLEARAQRCLGDCQYRFSASGAYHDLVAQRIEDLRETRIEGLQTFGEFTRRRLSPAMNTCRATAENLKDLALRIAQTTDLLATRVEVVRERQNRELLASMARRAKLQLRIQRTVEGLSIVAISYYVIGLVSYVLKGLKGAGIGINVDLATGLLIPIVLALVAVGLKRLIPERFTRD